MIPIAATLLLATTAAPQSVVFPAAPPSVSAVTAPPTIDGVLEVWQNVTLTFTSATPYQEASPFNPFTDVRLGVHFVRAGDPHRVITVPGYFAADGNAADTGAAGGDKWRVHFRPDAHGKWFYQVSMVTAP